MRAKRKPTKADQALEASWQALLARHSAPLERGAQAKGVKAPVFVKAKPRKPVPHQKRKPLPAPLPPSDLASRLQAAASSHHRGNVGAVFNKGGAQFISPDIAAEQRSGSHRRR